MTYQPPGRPLVGQNLNATLVVTYDAPPAGLVDRFDISSQGTTAVFRKTSGNGAIPVAGNIYQSGSTLFFQPNFDYKYAAFFFYQIGHQCSGRGYTYRNNSPDRNFSWESTPR